MLAAKHTGPSLWGPSAAVQWVAQSSQEPPKSCHRTARHPRPHRQLTFTTAPHFLRGGRAHVGSQAYSALTVGSFSSFAMGGTGLTRATQKLPPDAVDTPSGAPGRFSSNGSRVPACDCCTVTAGRRESVSGRVNRKAQGIQYACPLGMEEVAKCWPGAAEPHSV
jgi:hypothetical protein